jgi:hypothetical protein
MVGGETGPIAAPWYHKCQPFSFHRSRPLHARANGRMGERMPPNDFERGGAEDEFEHALLASSSSRFRASMM